MFKKFAVTAILLSVVATGAACSSDDNKDSAASPSATPAVSASAAASPAAAASEAPDAYKMKAYNAARIAEEKINTLFHTSTSEDKAVLNPLIATDKDKAAKFLNAYFDPALSEKILTFYLTPDKTQDGSILVKTDKFLPGSILAAKTKDDVTYEGTQDEVKMTTKDNMVFTAKKNSEGKYIITDVAKK
jgi:hypothetical protein